MGLERALAVDIHNEEKMIRDFDNHPRRYRTDKMHMTLFSTTFPIGFLNFYSQLIFAGFVPVFYPVSREDQRRHLPPYSLARSQQRERARTGCLARRCVSASRDVSVHFVSFLSNLTSPFHFIFKLLKPKNFYK